MLINNEILHDFIVCHYKAYRKSKHQTGIISDYQSLYNQLKQKGKENFERTITKNNNLTFYHQNFDNNAPEEGIFLNFKFANANIDITLDGIEFTGKKNITPIFITPFEKVTTTDKLFVSLQATLIETEFNLKILNCKVIHGKNLQGTQFKLSSTTKNIKKIIVELNKISFQNVGQQVSNKKGAKEGHKGKGRTFPKARRKIEVPFKRICPIHKSMLVKTSKTSEQTLTDIVFTKHTIRKTVIKYVGYKSFCSLCNKCFIPPKIQKIKGKHFGHNFKAWIVYERLFLRLPYNIIQLNLKELFSENISQGTLSDIIRYFSSFYNYTEKQNLKHILNSPFIHADETKVNVKGFDHYVWILTDGKQVIFRETETREIEMILGLLKEFKGILISDFYPGYESLKCKHQKCWVHLIRDLNEDLYKNPYDIEYEKFIVELRNLIIPIFESIEKYGSKKRHFNKFRKNIDTFYNRVILEGQYNSEITLKYQTRIKKHWKSLFTFIEFDNVPWNNNMAERGLRHLAVQRKISTFFDNGVKHYLLLLGIMQTCRFQNKSFLKFLLSGKKVLA